MRLCSRSGDHVFDEDTRAVGAGVEVAGAAVQGQGLLGQPLLQTADSQSVLDQVELVGDQFVT